MTWTVAKETQRLQSSDELGNRKMQAKGKSHFAQTGNCLMWTVNLGMENPTHDQFLHLGLNFRIGFSTSLHRFLYLSEHLSFEYKDRQKMQAHLKVSGQFLFTHIIAM